MAGRQAKTVSKGVLRQAAYAIRRRPTADRDIVILLLAIHAGLRASEIAGLQWRMVLNANGKIGTTIELEDRFAKRGSGRRIPIHADLKKALFKLLAISGVLDRSLCRRAVARCGQTAS